MNLTTGGGGLIHTPNYPMRYPINLSCEWHIYAKQPFAHILLQFPTFSVEGGGKYRFYLIDLPDGTRDTENRFLKCSRMTFFIMSVLAGCFTSFLILP